MNFPLNYEAPVYRPPSEGRSLLIQATIGCSHNKCTYCAMYRHKQYRERPLEEVLEDIDRVEHFVKKSRAPEPEKVFLCDGDALGAPTPFLLQILDHLNQKFPKIKRVSVYATAQNMLAKSKEELQFLAERKLNLAYLGLESGSNKVLKRIVKGVDGDAMIEGCHKLKDSGWKVSIIAMLGVGGKEYSAEHIQETARVVSAINPSFFSFLSTVAVPETPMAKMIDKKLMTELSSKELLFELYKTLESLNFSESCLFRVNHVSNQFQVGGELPQDKDRLVEAVKSWWQQCPEGVYPQVDPSYL